MVAANNLWLDVSLSSLLAAGVLTKTECSETLRDMGMPPSFDIRDPATYTLPEVEATLNRYGVVGRDTLWTPTILRNRCHPHVIKALQETMHSWGKVTIFDP